jgi:hypothetical protein
LDPDSADDYLLLDYFWVEDYEVWIPKLSSMYEPLEQEMADKLKEELSK